MPKLIQLPKFSELPRKGNPLGLMPLANILPTGDRGLVFGRSMDDGVPLGKIPGYWSCPYNGTITAVILSTDKGGYTVKIWKNGNRKSPTTVDSICFNGFSISPPLTNRTIIDLQDFIEIDVVAGDTFAVEVVEVSDPPPLDIAGNVVILKTEVDIEAVDIEIKI